VLDLIVFTREKSLSLSRLPGAGGGREGIAENVFRDCTFMDGMSREELEEIHD